MICFSPCRVVPRPAARWSAADLSARSRDPSQVQQRVPHVSLHRVTARTCITPRHRMLLDPNFGLEDQWLVTRMIYGAQSDAFDYHMVSEGCAVAGMLSCSAHDVGLPLR
jgi:hypothetical protein